MKARDAHESDCYTCESCKQHFKRAREDAECWEEYKENVDRGKKEMPDVIPEELEEDAVVIICDDCYLELKKRAPWLA